MAEEKVTADEVIINIVRENKVIYDKTDANYKNANKKKDVWRMISFHLKKMYNVDMSAENVEKRWTTLRDMFGREERRKKLRRSRSGNNENNEWHLYRSLLFLSSHIAHRRTQVRLIEKQKEGLNSQLVLPPLRKIEPSVECKDPLGEEMSQEIWSPPQIDHGYFGPYIIDNNAQPHPDLITRQSSSSSSSLFQFPPTSTNSRELNSCMKPTLIKMIAPMDDCASQKKMKSAYLDEQLVKAVNAMSNSMTTVSTLITSTANKDKEKDGYMLAIEEGLKHVPVKSRTQCIIEVLQVIQKYEIRE